MTLREMKLKVLTLIEESDTEQPSLTNDPDIEAKLPYVINQIIFELARFKKIPAYIEQDVEENETLDLSNLDSFYQLQIIRGVDYLPVNETTVKFKEEGTAEISYYKYPERIDETTEDTYTFELSEDALEIAPYGIAADLLKSDVSNSYGEIYAKRYQEMISRLDSRYSMPSVYIDGGEAI